MRRPWVKISILLSILVGCPGLSFCASSITETSGRALGIDAFIDGFIAQTQKQLHGSEQLIFATNRDSSSTRVTISALEKRELGWKLAFPPFDGAIGRKGFAAFGNKFEGDGKSPTGIFTLGTAFGYPPSVPTKMEYRQTSHDDFWVDDPDSADYNKWVKGKPKAASWENMRRNDDRYKYGILIEYNMRPVVKGNGSAIFLHVWKDGASTSGCVSVSEEVILKILGWLDPAKKPLIVMGTESELMKTLR